MEHAKRAVARLSPARDRDLLPQAWLDLGRFLAHRDHPVRALEHFASAEALFRETHDASGIARVRMHRARLHLDLGQIERAEGDLAAAQEIAVRQQDERMAARLHQLAAEAHLARGEREHAAARCADALRTAVRVGDRHLRALAHRTKALIHLSALPPDLAQSLEEAELALEMAAELALPRLTVLANETMARACLALGDPDGALALCEQAVSYLRGTQLGLALAARVERVRAAALAGLGRRDEAARSRRRAERMVQSVSRRLPPRSRARFLAQEGVTQE
jgi:tetratricopeptide (TPR) repeat protein